MKNVQAFLHKRKSDAWPESTEYQIAYFYLILVQLAVYLYRSSFIHNLLSVISLAFSSSLSLLLFFFLNS